MTQIKNRLFSSLIIISLLSSELSFAAEPPAAAAAPAAPAQVAAPAPVAAPEEKKPSKSAEEKKVTAEAAPAVKEDSILSALDYPELQVVPRASDRMIMEKDVGMASWWPYYLSGLTSVAAGLAHRGKYRDPAATSQTQSDSDWAASLGLIAGIGTMGMAMYVGSQEYYVQAMQNAKRYARPDGKVDKRADLMKERIAEEAMEQAARAANKMKWAAFTANFISAAYIQTYAQDTVRPVVFAALISSTLPLIFSHRYELNYEKHLEYKRKIYAPLANVGFDKELQPALVLTWNY